MTAAAFRIELAEAVLPALQVKILRVEVARQVQAMQEADGADLHHLVAVLYDYLLKETCQPEPLDFLRANEARHAVWECLRRCPAIEEEKPCAAPRAA